MRSAIALGHFKPNSCACWKTGVSKRVGGTQLIEVDVRIVVATIATQKLMQENLFREDLYFRISAVPITIPALRDRATMCTACRIFSR